MPRLSRTLGWTMAVVVGAALLVADLGAVFFLQAMLERDLSVQLTLSARQMARFYVDTGGQLPQRLPLGQQVAVYGPSGTLLQATGPVPSVAPQPGFSTTPGRLGYAQPLPSGQLYYASVSQQSVQAPVGLLEDALIVLTLLALALAVAVSQRLARGIARPLTELADAAGRIAETGDLEEELPLGGRVLEIANLANALGRMLGTLRSMFQALEGAEARSRALREGTLHDLRTPLSTVLGALELMEGGQLQGGAADEAVRLARREAARLATRLSTDSEGGPAIGDLRAAVRRAARGHEFGDSVEGVVVAAPPQEIAQVLSLLVDNAERHNPQGTKIRLSCGSSEAFGWAEVADEGRGMSAEESARAFERFYRGPGSQGLGLGLSLVHVLVESRGGSVELTSAPGAGTRVRVQWPLGKPDDA